MGRVRGQSARQRGGRCEGSEGGHAGSVKKLRSPVWLEWRMKWTVVRSGGLEVSSGPVPRPWHHGRDLRLILTWENPLEAPGLSGPRLDSDSLSLVAMLRTG